MVQDGRAGTLTMNWGLSLIRRKAGRGRLRRIVVRKAPGSKSRGVVAARGIRSEAALGHAGIGRTKREGDGRTPAGRFRLVGVFYRTDRVRRPATILPVSVIRNDLGWCDDPSDRAYNRPVLLPYARRHERMWRGDRHYDIVVVIDFNLARPVPGAGSAIFLHIAATDVSPTEGCIALSEHDLRLLLSAAGPRTIVDIA
jgi:L,D-peptidoglycan transpeptidase YkuD (ErfK/YbiS/YcfS/YnhG family)